MEQGTPQTDSECAICQEAPELEEIMCILPCKHAYHRDCIHAWLARRATCPTCAHRRCLLVFTVLQLNGLRCCQRTTQHATMHTYVHTGAGLMWRMHLHLSNQPRSTKGATTALPVGTGVGKVGLDRHPLLRAVCWETPPTCSDTHAPLVRHKDACCIGLLRCSCLSCLFFFAREVAWVVVRSLCCLFDRLQWVVWCWSRTP